MSQSKALRLARYLKEFVALRSTTVYDVNKYESVLWFGDMPQEPECQSPAWNDEFVDGDPWLVVHSRYLPTANSDVSSKPSAAGVASWCRGRLGQERATQLQTWCVTCWPVGSEC
jgi:hypothetical protein